MLSNYQPSLFMNREEAMLNQKILIVDDARNLGLLYKQELEEDGYNIDLACSVKNAIQYLDGGSYDLVIIETALKDLRDIEKLRHKLTNSNGLPIIINSAYPKIKHDQALWSSEACLLKTSDLSYLKDKVKKIIGD